MNCTRTAASTALSKQSAAHVFKALGLQNGSTTATSFAKPIFIGIQRQPETRSFTTTGPRHLKEFFPEPDAPSIRETKPAWAHPGFKPDQMRAVKVAHRESRDLSDRVALTFSRVLRWSLDTASGYNHKPGGMTERQYLIRNIFLESVAGVPGMVAGMLRHLRSMRAMKRDNGWMETLLEESYNERMHLLTFLKLAEPGWFMRLMVLGAQGVFFNAFFVSYLISPRTCHRFVGYIEEEAVITYSREIADLEAGHLPKWEKTQAPDIAIKYWNMPKGHRTMLDLLYYIRADESKHREVNHTLGNLDQRNDPNPYASEYKDKSVPHPSKDLSNPKPTGWERNEVI